MAVSVKEEFGGSAQSSGRAYDREYGDGGSEGVTTDTVYLPMARFNRKNIDSITTSVISRFDKLITDVVIESIFLQLNLAIGK